MFTYGRALPALFISTQRERDTYDLRWRSSCCLRPSSRKKEYSATRALLSESPKSLVPFGLLFQQLPEWENKQENLTCGSGQVGCSPCLQSSLIFSACFWALCMPCVTYDWFVSLCFHMFPSWGRNQRNWGYCFSLRPFNGRDTHLDLNFPLLFCLLLTAGLGRLELICRKETMLLTCKMWAQIFILWSVFIFANINMK